MESSAMLSKATAGVSPLRKVTGSFECEAFPAVYRKARKAVLEGGIIAGYVTKAN